MTRARVRLAKNYENETSRTKEGDQKAADINNMMVSYQTQGVMPDFNQGEPHYGDYSNAVDYTTAMQRTRSAQSEFNLLPVGIRAKFKYDVAEMMEFVENPDNLAEAQELGILPAPEPGEETPTVVDTPTPVTDPDTLPVQGGE